MLAANTLGSLCICTDSPEHLLFADAICTEVSCIDTIMLIVSLLLLLGLMYDACYKCAWCLVFASCVVYPLISMASGD